MEKRRNQSLVGLTPGKIQKRVKVFEILVKTFVSEIGDVSFVSKFVSNVEVQKNTVAKMSLAIKMSSIFLCGTDINCGRYINKVRPRLVSTKVHKCKGRTLFVVYV